MYILIRSAIVLVVIVCTLTGQEYIWPTDASHLLTSSFAEYRPDRFHAGIDIKTWGRVGYKIFAVRPGYISRINVSPNGYGRAIYFTLDTGETAVYAHLQRFIDEIEDYVWHQQQRRGRYSVVLYPNPYLFTYKQGKVLGYTGQTGIGVPHLHFEMRDKDSRPFNPLLKEFKLADEIAPHITSISVSQLTAFSRINGYLKPVILYPKNTGNNRYVIEDTLYATGLIAFGMNVSDRMNGTNNRFATYRNRLFIDDREIFSARYDRFSYQENNQSNLDRDYRSMIQGQGLFYRFYRDFGNHLSYYSSENEYYGAVYCERDGESGLLSKLAKSFDMANATPDGVVTLEGGPHNFAIEAQDYWGNTSIVRGVIHSGDMEPSYVVPAGPSEAESPDETIFYVDPTFYDHYIRLEINALRSESFAPRVFGRDANGPAHELDVTARNSKSFVTGWPLSENARGTITLEIRTANGEMMQQSPVNFNTIAVGRSKRLQTEDGRCQIDFNEKSLHKTIYVRMQTQPSQTESLYRYASPIYVFEPIDVPLNRGALISLEYPENDSLVDKLAIYGRVNGDEWNFIGNRLDRAESKISARTTGLGNFALIRDTVPPVITLLWPENGRRIRDKYVTLKARFMDALAGIGGEEDMVLKLDGRKLIAEYDPEADALSYKPREPLPVGEHTVEIIVRDRSGNESRKKHTFQVE